jgi:GH15 family glucan-1,4-alpha-glucosidase
MQLQRYLPIAEHGLIGDLHTAALVGTDGTIDWYCCPNFDSPSVFAAILDADRGGHFALRPSATSWQTKQLYFPDSNVLITRFLTPDGVGEVEDFMPIGESRAGGAHRQRIIRRVVAVRGRMRFELECAPRFDYAREPHRTERHPHGALFETRAAAWRSKPTPRSSCTAATSARHSNSGPVRARPSSSSTSPTTTSSMATAPRRRASCSKLPSPTGAAGCPNRATGVAGARRFTDRR